MVRPARLAVEQPRLLHNPCCNSARICRCRGVGWTGLFLGIGWIKVRSIDRATSAQVRPCSGSSKPLDRVKLAGAAVDQQQHIRSLPSGEPSHQCTLSGLGQRRLAPPRRSRPCSGQRRGVQRTAGCLAFMRITPEVETCFLNRQRRVANICSEIGC
jgi:hypothetical protein